MTINHLSMDMFNLSRFVQAQGTMYDDVLAELNRGKKVNHWMWFIFPQVKGLGISSTSEYFGISGVEEAKAYLRHPILGKRLLECSEALLDIEERSATVILGYPDDIKLRSSMSLFEFVSEPNSIFTEVLNKFFQGRRDEKTICILQGRKA